MLPHSIQFELRYNACDRYTHVYMENAMIQIFQKRKLVHFYINFSAYLSSHVVLRSCHIDMHPRVTTR